MRFHTIDTSVQYKEAYTGHTVLSNNSIAYHSNILNRQLTIRKQYFNKRYIKVDNVLNDFLQ